MSTDRSPNGRPDLIELDFSEYEHGPWQEFAERRGWGDGLPLVPPTPERVRELVEATGLAPDAVLGTVPPAWGQLTAEKLAANAVMAGARASVIPLLVAAMRAALDPAFNLYAIQATTNPVGPAVIVSGPAIEKAGIASGYGCLGPGFSANATLGRALRLILLNVGGARPGGLDRATLGYPGKFSLVFGENERRCPWETFGASRGLADGTSGVTVFGVTCLSNHLDHSSTNAEQLTDSLARSLACYGFNPLYSGGQTLLILGPEHAEILARGIGSRAELQERLWEKAAVPAAILGDENLRLIRRKRAEYPQAVDGNMIHVIDSPSDLLVVVAGGDGLHSMVGPGLVGTVRAVTVQLNPV